MWPSTQWAPDQATNVVENNKRLGPASVVVADGVEDTFSDDGCK